MFWLPGVKKTINYQMTKMIKMTKLLNMAFVRFGDMEYLAVFLGILMSSLANKIWPGQNIDKTSAIHLF